MGLRYGVRLRYQDGIYAAETLTARYWVIDLAAHGTLSRGPYDSQHEAEEMAAQMNVGDDREQLGS